MKDDRKKRRRPAPQGEPPSRTPDGEEIPLIEAQDPDVIDQQEGRGWTHDTTRRIVPPAKKHRG
jgi:hypothetical protein